MENNLHESDVKKLQVQVFCNRGTRLCLAKTTAHSNMTRSSSYKKDALCLPIDTLNRILSIDKEQMIAHVEPRVSMYELATACFKKGLIPVVVPEFKGITVGGAVMGCGGESSSHKYGLFHDACESLEVLTGDGRNLTISQTSHEDLFNGLAGSYGSLGVLLAARIRLQEAKPFVNLTVRHFSSGADSIEYMRKAMHNSEPSEYIEGIIFSEEHAAVIEGNLSLIPAGKVYKDSPFAEWYYQFVRESESFSMPLIDYLFRYDRGAFWMGSYVFYPAIFKKLCTEAIWKVKTPELFTDSERLEFAKIREPHPVLRTIGSPFASSQKLYSLLHTCEDWVQHRMIVQDFTLPESTVRDFLHDVENICPVYPLWLCPVRSSQDSQLFAPHDLQGQNGINIGVYGIPNNTQSIRGCVEELEQKLKEKSGRKWLYTHSGYSQEEFWNIYDKAAYQKLREKYGADGVWLSIEDKVLSD